MEVILLQDVERLGKAGEHVNVRDGFSRNYLLPRKLAILSSEVGLKFLEAKKKRAEEKRKKEVAEVTQLAERLEKWSCVIKAKVGEEGKLFGSVTRQDIASRLQSEGFNVDKRQIDLFEPIHRVGKY